MPIIVILAALAIIIGVGGYFFRPQSTVTPEVIEVTPDEVSAEVVPDVRDAKTVPDETGDDAMSGQNVPAEPGDNPTVTPETTTLYNDGSYNIATAYTVPNRANHTVAVAFTVANDSITGAKIVFGGDDVPTSKGYQAKFVAAYESEVIGKKLDDVKLSRVGGASLTSNAFNDAVAKLKVAAQN